MTIDISMEQQKATVLFVDDEENVLRSVRRLFLEENLDVVTATSGKEGLRILRENKVAVVVSDQRMPEMGGAEFLEKAQRVSPNSVRIILTGYADVGAAVDAINMGGAFRYLTKPWNDNDLLGAIKDAAERYRLTSLNKYLTDLTRNQNEELKRWSSLLEARVRQQTEELEQQNFNLKTLNEKLHKNFRESIVAFSSLIELRDSAVHSHSHHVAFLSKKICEKIGLGDEETDRIEIAAQLHDIGKIGMSDLILLKPLSDLVPDEVDEYRKHPVRGQSTVDSIKDLQEVGILIRHHHEAINGEGFPDGLRGEQVPLGSKIIAIADSFDRYLMASKASVNPEEILNRIKGGLRLQFDYDLYRPLAQSVRENLEALIPHNDNQELEVPPRDLRVGMVVSRDVRSGTGLLLMGAGFVLNERSIEIIRRCYHFDPLNTGVFVKTQA
jgi:response regulator RpfG family c-di-GMP phosphodiesterase